MVRTRSQRTIAHVLPRELLSRCIEFLPLEELQPYTKDAYREREYVDMGESHILWKPPAEAKRVSKGFRSAARYALTKGRYRPVHSFLDAVQNDWQDRDVADSVASEIESFRIWGPALWDARESATDEIDVPRDYVPAATA